MAGIFIAAGTVTGGLVGLMAAIVLSPFGRFSTGMVLATVAVGVVLDGLQLAAGRPRPPTAGRQVPREWGRLFDPRITALLYGARLGVGPLTILSTWTWWSVTIAAALLGPVAATAVGAFFGLTRLIITVAVSGLSALAPEDLRAEHHQLLFRRLRARRRSNWIAINSAGFVAVLAVVLTGCGSTTADKVGEAVEESQRPMMEASSSTTSTIAIAGSGRPDTTTPDRTIATVALEDIVRSDSRTENQDGIPHGSSTSTIDPIDDPIIIPSSEPAALAGALLETIDGYEAVDDPAADRHLDLAAAADLQPDPTEEVALLETRGFKGGWTRAFRNRGNDVAVASIYQFRDAAEAEFYLEDGLITIGGYGGKFFDIEDQPGVRGFVQHFSETDEVGTEELVSLGAAFQAGPRWHLVYFVGSAETVTPDVLIPAIAAQRELAEPR